MARDASKHKLACMQEGAMPPIAPSRGPISVRLPAHGTNRMCREKAQANCTEQPHVDNADVRAKGTQPFTQGQGCNDCKMDEQSSLNKETRPSGRSCYVDLQVAQHSKFDNRAAQPAKNSILLSTSTAGKMQTTIRKFGYRRSFINESPYTGNTQ